MGANGHVKKRNVRSLCSARESLARRSFFLTIWRAFLFYKKLKRLTKNLKKKFLLQLPLLVIFHINITNKFSNQYDSSKQNDAENVGLGGRWNLLLKLKISPHSL